MKKKILFSLIIFIFFSLFLYFGTFLYIKIFYGFNNLELVKYKNQISFIEKYHKRLHHLRHYENKLINTDEVENLLFTKGRFNNVNNKTSILFMGDSWMEQAIYYKKSDNLINNYSKKKNINYYNAGISSYSPTLMNIQYQILKTDFNLNPDFIVLYIDQTDFGDDLCRYKKNKRYVKGELYGVQDFFYAPRMISMLEIDIKYKNLLLREIIQFNHYVKEKSFIATNKFKSLFKLNKNIYGCDLENIFRYLINPTKSEIKYFRDTIKDLFENLINEDSIKNVMVVTFPHRNHLEHVSNENNYGDYNYSVEEAVDYYIANNNSKKINHLKFSKYFEKNLELISASSFIPKDKASHLSEDFHSDVFIKEIINEIDKIMYNNS
jgi:hypothetical protein